MVAACSPRGVAERSGVAAGAVGHVVVGNLVPTETNDAYLSRVALPVETQAFNVNRLCGSGLQAIVSAAQAIALGDCDFAVAGRAESMSSGPYIASAARWGARLGDGVLVDYMNGILHDPWQKLHMGITAENVAARYGIDPVSQDALALESQRPVARAIADGRLKDQIVTTLLRIWLAVRWLGG